MWENEADSVYEVEINKALKKRSEEGWELVNAQYNNLSAKYSLFFKRKLEITVSPVTQEDVTRVLNALTEKAYTSAQMYSQGVLGEYLHDR